MAHLSYEDAGITEPEEGIIQFEILPEHLKLLRGLQLQWVTDDCGGLRTNPRRPYGSLDMGADVRKILENDDLTDDEIVQLHRGAAMALQIALKTGKFRAKVFRAQKYSQDWHEYMTKKVKPKDEEGQLTLDAAEDGNEES